MKHASVRASFALLVAFSVPFLGWAQAEPQTPSPASQPAESRALNETRRLVDRPDERVSILENGLTVILKAHRTAPVVCVQMYCKTGSIYEQEYLGAGMSHLFEHLLHGAATSTRTEEQSRTILDDIGGNTNAFTSYDMTCYYINTTRDHATTAIELLGSWITDPIFPQEAFDREWGVVQRELERDIDDPDHQLNYLTMETMYRDHPARYPIIGYQPVVQSLKKSDIVGYYHRMYVPDNIVVAVVGDINLDDMLKAVEAKFAGFQRQRVPNIVLPEQEPMTTPRSASKEMRVESAMLQLAWPSIRLTDPDLFALDVLSYLLTQGDSSRLVRTIRDTGLAYGVESYSWTPQWAKGIFVVGTRLDPAKIDEAKAAILKQIGLLQEQLVSADELDKAKKQKAAEHVMASQTAESVASMMSTDYVSTGDIHFSQAYVDKIQQVTPEQIRDVARKYLLPERLGTITILPQGASAAKGDQAAATAAPAPVKEIKLDNGLRVLIRQDPTTPLVAIQAYSLGGLAYENDKTNGLSRLASLLVPRGTKTRTAQDIAQFFDARGGSFSVSSGNNSMVFQAEVLKGDFPKAMEVFADAMLNPVFAKDELELFRPQLVEAIKRIGETWRPELLSYARHRFYRNSPYRFDDLGSASVVSNATQQEVADFYHHLVTAPDTVLAIYGDVDATLAESLARRLFADMPTQELPVPAVEAEPQVEGPRLYILKKSPERKAAGIAIGYRGMTVRDKKDRAEIAVLDTITSGYRYPTGWLFESLRGGNKNLVYEVAAVNQPGILPGLFFAYAACQPDKVNEVYGIMKKQFDKAIAGEFTPEELKQAKSIITTSELMENQTNSSRAMQDALNVLYGLGYQYDAEFLHDVNNVTLDDVKRVARKYLVNPQIAIVTPAPDQVDIGIKPTAVDSTRVPEQN